MSYDETPLEPLLPLASEARARQGGPPPRHLVMLMDTSGSMCGGPLTTAQQIAISIVNRYLRPHDLLDLMAFTTSASARLTDEPMTPQGKARAMDEIRRMTLRWRHGSEGGAAAARRATVEELRAPLLFRRRLRSAAAALAVPPRLPHDGLRDQARAVLAERTDERACRSHSRRFGVRSPADQNPVLRSGREEPFLRARRLHGALDEARPAERLRDGGAGDSARGIGDDLAERRRGAGGGAAEADGSGARVPRERNGERRRADDGVSGGLDRARRRSRRHPPVDRGRAAVGEQPPLHVPAHRAGQRSRDRHRARARGNRLPQVDRIEASVEMPGAPPLEVSVRRDEEAPATFRARLTSRRPTVRSTRRSC